MHLSSLRAVDRPRVSELLVATGAFSDEEVGVALELLDATYDSGESVADYEFVGAFDTDDRLLGYACYGTTPATDGTYDLYWLAVDPASQGHGAGRALVLHVERSLAARGARLLIAETSSRESYAHARQFYARCGYTEAARVRDFYAPADDRIILTTRLMARAVGVATR